MKNLLILCALTLPLLGISQTPFQWDVGGALGITSYQGDLDALTINAGFREIKYSANIFLRRNISNNFALRLNLLAGKLAGDDNNFAEPEWRVRRGISFESPLVEFALLSEFYFPGMYPKKITRGRRMVVPYFLFGIGGAYSNPTVDWNDENGNEEINPALAQQDKDAKTNKIHFVVPIGLGFRFKLKDHSTFGLEAALRPTFSDYLDGVSAAGNNSKQDWFFTAQIGISSPFGKYKAKPQNKHAAKEEEKEPKKPKQKKAPISDLDKDGTGDFEDECVDVPGPKNLKGCPDKDHDGIPDKDDVCSEQPGPAALNGCPDADKDGIADKDDKCPEVPGLAAYRGCPPSDRDEDGVGDAEDLCPDEAGEAGWNGCPDTDADGVPDHKDECPETAGSEKFAGCPDTDADGIPDKDDNCPEEAGVAALKGCPNLPPPDKAIYFGTTSQNWYRTSDETLDEVIEILSNDPSLNAHISGHTDDTGEQAAEGDLSALRAKKVYDYLISKGIAASRLKFEGYGSSRPAPTDIKSQDPLLNRQLNRRAEVHFLRE